MVVGEASALLAAGESIGSAGGGRWLVDNVL